MRLIIVILFIPFLFTSCTHSGQREKDIVTIDSTAIKVAIKDGYTKRTVKLKNGLGTVSIYLPTELDTFYVHRHYTDIAGREGYVFRFSSKKYGIFLHDSIENWFLTKELPDSIYAFVITQHNAPKFKWNNVGMNDTTIKYLEEDIKAGSGNKMLWINDTVINNRKYVLYKSRQSKEQICAVLCMVTLIKGYDIGLGFNYVGAYLGDFFNKMTVSLNTLEIKSDSIVH